MGEKENSANNKAEENYYKLNKDAVERLASVNSSNARKVSDDELNKYNTSKLSKIPVGVKAFFIKFWFAGAVCFFFYWGLGAYFNRLDLIFILGIAMGMVTDLLTKNILLFLSSDKNEYNYYLMFTERKYYTFIGNIVYAFLVMSITVGIYAVLKIGVGPILFGIIYTAVDLFFVGVRNYLRAKLRKN